ncbi:hypothetical protein LY78DRAFT_26633 [Colletotrichum sublineola]|nr:hypothetical protein LY78DRAFT_26633 [Colletotrichum sublineola]
MSTTRSSNRRRCLCRKEVHACRAVATVTVTVTVKMKRVEQEKKKKKKADGTRWHGFRRKKSAWTDDGLRLLGEAHPSSANQASSGLQSHDSSVWPHTAPSLASPRCGAEYGYRVDATKKIHTRRDYESITPPPPTVALGEPGGGGGGFPNMEIFSYTG